jgi:S-adenosylmethionine hydrolase
MKKKSKKIEEAQVNPELKGLDIHVNEFGEIISNISSDKLNDFLDRNVIDKKLEEKKHKEAIAKNLKKSKKK